jgi:type VI secretion system protein VasG
MVSVDRKSLINRLNTTCHNALEAAAALCLSRRHNEVDLEHLLVKLIATPDTDIERIFRHYQIDQARLSQDIILALERLKTCNSRTPALSSRLLDLMLEAWVFASINFSVEKVRSGQLLLALLANGSFLRRAKGISAEFNAISAESLHHHFGNIVAGSIEDVEGKTILNVYGSDREDRNLGYGVNQ